MGLSHIDHYNLEISDLETSLAFYCDVLGLKNGFRPPLSRPGAWLYGENGHPSIHLISDGLPEKHRKGPLHHICFAATGKDAIRERLTKAGIPFKTVVLPRVNNTQFFLADPNGLNVEINFPPEETTQADRDVMDRERLAT